jgi:hypothetical protein
VSCSTKAGQTITTVEAVIVVDERKVNVCPTCGQVIGSGYIPERDDPYMERLKAYFRYLRKHGKKNNVKYHLLAECVFDLQARGHSRTEAIELTAKQFTLGPHKFSTRTIQRALSYCGM